MEMIADRLPPRHSLSGVLRFATASCCLSHIWLETKHSITNLSLLVAQFQDPRLTASIEPIALSVRPQSMPVSSRTQLVVAVLCNWLALPIHTSPAALMA